MRFYYTKTKMSAGICIPEEIAEMIRRHAVLKNPMTPSISYQDLFRMQKYVEVYPFDDSALLGAIARGDLDYVRLQIKIGIREKSHRKIRAFDIACKHGYVEIARALLECFQGFLSKDELYYYARLGFIHVFRNHDAGIAKLISPILGHKHLCACDCADVLKLIRKRATEVVKAILSNLSPDDQILEDSFATSIVYHEHEILEYVLKKMDLRLISRAYSTTRLLSPFASGNYEIAKLLIDHAPPDIPMGRFIIWCEAACGYGNTEIIKLFLDIVPFKNLSASSLISTLEKRCDIAKIIARVFTPEKLRFEKNKAFKISCENGCTDVVQHLLTVLSLEDFRVTNNYGFRLACRNGHSKIVEMLLRVLEPSDIRAKKNEGFLNACRNGHVEIVKLLAGVLSVEEIRSALARGFLEEYMYDDYTTHDYPEIRKIFAEMGV